jgi:hypothetical protein
MTQSKFRSWNGQNDVVEFWLNELHLLLMGNHPRGLDDWYCATIHDQNEVANGALEVVCLVGPRGSREELREDYGYLPSDSYDEVVDDIMKRYTAWKTRKAARGGLLGGAAWLQGRTP